MVNEPDENTDQSMSHGWLTRKFLFSNNLDTGKLVSTGHIKRKKNPVHHTTTKKHNYLKNDESKKIKKNISYWWSSLLDGDGCRTPLCVWICYRVRADPSCERRMMYWWFASQCGNSLSYTLILDCARDTLKNTHTHFLHSQWLWLSSPGVSTTIKEKKNCNKILRVFLPF